MPISSTLTVTLLHVLIKVVFVRQERLPLVNLVHQDTMILTWRPMMERVDAVEMLKRFALSKFKYKYEN